MKTVRATTARDSRAIRATSCLSTAVARWGESRPRNRAKPSERRRVEGLETIAQVLSPARRGTNADRDDGCPARSTLQMRDRRRLRQDAPEESARRTNGSYRSRLPLNAAERRRVQGIHDAVYRAQPRRRNFSSPAALCVNVTAAILSIVVLPWARTATMRLTNSLVLPVPAEASTIRLSSREVRIRSRAASSACTTVEGFKPYL